MWQSRREAGNRGAADNAGWRKRRRALDGWRASGAHVATNGGNAVSGSASQKLSFQAMVFTVCLFPFYILAATLTNSSAILSDLLSTSFDLTALTACWLVLRVAHGANTGKYAYGLGKLENLAELMIAVLQSVLVIVAATQAISHIMHPEGVSGAELGLFVTGAAVVGNVVLNRKATRLAVETKSPVLAAQARVHLVSAIGSGAVFLVTVVTSIFNDVYWVFYLDPMASFVVIGFMIYNILAMLTNSVASLLDQAIGEAGQLRILKVLTAHFDDFSELGDIRTRQFGGKMFVELHLGFDDGWTMAHTRTVVSGLVRAVEAAFREAGDEAEVSVVLIPARAG